MDEKLERTTARITHEAYGEKQTIEFSAECDIHEYIDQIERLLVAISFYPETVKEGFLAKADEIDLIEEQKASVNEEDFHTE